MIRLAVAFLLTLAMPALAQTGRVTSGEHDGFTRVVIDFGKPVDWQFGRSESGYELRQPDAQMAYDLTSAFALIGKSRLAALDAPQGTGRVQIGLACACHAIPFEFRPGIVVIDLKDGPPPKNSVFEEYLEQPAASASPNTPETSPAESTATAGFDWTDDALQKIRAAEIQPKVAAPSAERHPETALLPLDPSLQPLRDTLMRQLAQGATQGVVEMADIPAETDLPVTDFPSAQIRIGEARNKATDRLGSQDRTLGATGTTCTPGELLDLASWGSAESPATDQIAELRRSLSGEFDRAKPESVEKAVKLYLYLGFGAEARQLADAFDLTSENGAVWRALGSLLDDQPDQEHVFSGQAACDGPSALWSFLADDTLVKGDPVNEGAIRLAFTALPLHLRELLGLKLSERFLAIGNENAARALSDSISRASGAAGNEAKLIEAELNLHLGDAGLAEELAGEVLQDPGQDRMQALIAQVEARVAQKRPIAADTVIELEAFLRGTEGSAQETQLREILMLAQASSGDFKAAFQTLPEFPRQRATLWDLLANLATDEVFLTHSVLGAETAPPQIPDEIAAALARRLAGLGLGTPAKQWLNTVESPDPRLVAEIALLTRDAPAVLKNLPATDDDTTFAMRLQALEALGDFPLQADLTAKAGDLAAASIALAKAGDWQGLAKAESSPWQAVAAEVAPVRPPDNENPDPPKTGALGQGHALVEAGERTRTSISALLAAVPRPETKGP